MATAFTDHVGIEVPLICGAMYPCSNPELIAAVSEARHRESDNDVCPFECVDLTADECVLAFNRR